MSIAAFEGELMIISVFCVFTKRAQQPLPKGVVTPISSFAPVALVTRRPLFFGKCEGVGFVGVGFVSGNCPFNARCTSFAVGRSGARGARQR